MTKIYNRINDNGELIGWSRIASDKTIRHSVKPVFKDEKAIWNGTEWTYKWEEYPEEKVEELDRWKNYTTAFFSQMLNYLFPLCGDTVVKHTGEISVLIPCYGKALYVKEAVLSAINQTLKPKEIVILLMDKESQALKDELNAMSDIVNAIDSKKMNASKARNTLVKKCKTEWFVFLDADDKLEENFLEVLDKEEGSVCFGACYKWFKDRCETLDPIERVRDTNITHILVSNLTSLMCKTVFNEFLLDEDLALGGEDTDFIFNVLEQRKYKVTYTPKTHFYYRQEVDGQLTRGEEYNGSLYKMLGKHKDFLITELRANLKYQCAIPKLLWCLENYSKENIYVCLYVMFGRDGFNYRPILVKLLKNYFYNLLKESKKKKPLASFDRDEFIITGQFPTETLTLDGKTFDVIFNYCNSNSFFEESFLEEKTMIINKTVYEDLKEKGLKGFSATCYLLENYACYEWESVTKYKEKEIEQEEADIASKEEEFDNVIFNMTFPEELQEIVDRHKYNVQTSYEMFTTLPPDGIDINFELHNVCNKKCPYCWEQNKDLVLSDDEMYERFDKALTYVEKLYDKRIRPFILGGEPTIWSRDFQNRIIERLKDYRTYIVFTNGTNTESPFYKDPRAIISHHVTDYLHSNYEPMNGEILNYVVPKNEISKLDNFLKTHKITEDKHVFQFCRSANEELNCGVEEAIEMKNIMKNNNLENAFTRGVEYLEKNGVKKLQEKCRECFLSTNRVLQIDCNTMMVGPCCGNRETVPLEELTKNYKITDCGDCLMLGWLELK